MAAVVAVDSVSAVDGGRTEQAMAAAVVAVVASKSRTVAAQVINFKCVHALLRMCPVSTQKLEHFLLTRHLLNVCVL